MTSVSLSSADYAWALATDVPVAAIVDGDQLIAIDLSTYEHVMATLPPGVRDVAISADGSRIFVARIGSRSQEFTRSDTELVGVDAPGSGYNVIATGSSWVLSGSEGDVQWVTHGESSLAFEYRAHRGPISGLGVLAGGRLATVGADHYLRLWEPLPEQVTYPVPGAAELVFDQFDLSTPSTRVANRSMLALSPEGDRLSYLLQSISVLGILDADSLEPTTAPIPLIQITVAYVPLPSGRAAFFADGSTGVIDLERRSVIWQRSLDIARAALIATASPDGERLAYAVPGGLVSYGRSDEPVITPFESTRTPVAVLLDLDGRASAVTSTGDWYREGAPPTRLPVGTSPVVSAALAPDGTLVVLQGNGALSRYVDEQLIPFAQVDVDLDAFALRFSPDGQLVAVIGTARTIVLNGQSGSPVMDLFPVGQDGSVVRDVALTATAVWQIRADGGVVTRPILDDEAVIAAIATHAPRTMTPVEVEALAAAIDTIGQA